MKPVLLAVLILAAAPASAVALASDQTTPAPVPSAQTGRWSGLPVADIVGRLTAAGLVVAEPRTVGDRVYLRVEDGALRWVLTLFSCTAGTCPDVQFTVAFSGPLASEAVVSRWNGARRFVKAFHAAPETEGGEGRAVAQYDVLLVDGGGPEQLDDPIQVWRSLAQDLGRTVNPPAGE